MMKRVLVLASEDDLHADAVLDTLQRRLVSCIRFDPETDWTTKVSLHWQHEKSGLQAGLVVKGEYIPASSIRAVFCRNWNFFDVCEADPVSEHLRAAEMKAGLKAFLQTLDKAFWVNKPWIEDFYDCKMIQAVEAIRHGLPVPEMLVTNQPASLVQFAGEHSGKLIIKQLSEISIFDTEITLDEGLEPGVNVYGFYTSDLGPVPREAFPEIRSCPILVQNKIDKQADIRATVVGHRVFANRINSQDRAESRTDFRRVLNLEVEPWELPADVRLKLVSMLTTWGIHFAACDFALTPDNKHIFLEANLTGNWLWLEGPEQFPIVNAIADDLVACGLENDSCISI
jgi:hypothetical protein